MSPEIKPSRPREPARRDFRINTAAESPLSEDNISPPGGNRIFQVKNRISKSDRLLGRLANARALRSNWPATAMTPRNAPFPSTMKSLKGLLAAPSSHPPQCVS